MSVSEYLIVLLIFHASKRALWLHFTQSDFFNERNIIILFSTWHWFLNFCLAKSESDQILLLLH